MQAPIEFLLKQQDITRINTPIGTRISSVGDACDHMIILQAGLVRVYRPAEDGRSITLYHISAGESCILTVSCILNAQPFPAMAETEQATKGFLIPASRLHHWLKNEPQWQQYIFCLLSQRMGDLISLVDALAFRQLDIRLAQWLLDQPSRQNIIQTTHQVIAEDLASSREVISRLLKEFERNQLIHLRRGAIEIRRRNQIQNLIETV